MTGYRKLNPISSSFPFPGGWGVEDKRFKPLMTISGLPSPTGHLSSIQNSKRQGFCSCFRKSGQRPHISFLLHHKITLLVMVWLCFKLRSVCLWTPHSSNKLPSDESNLSKVWMKGYISTRYFEMCTEYKYPVSKSHHLKAGNQENEAWEICFSYSE